MHNGMIDVDNVKMSKSLGNFFTVREVAQAYGYEPIRYLMLSAHYRSPFNYSVESLEQAKASLQRLYTCRENLDFALSNAAEDGDAMDWDRYREDFVAAMEEDLNTADALGCIFELVREINTRMAGASKQALAQAVALFDELTGVLGLVYNRREAGALDAQVEALIAERAKARSEKNWKRADEIRAQLGEMGVAIEDTPQGTKVLLG
jgi:cysteinyl-tRNA synthetase